MRTVSGGESTRGSEAAKISSKAHTLSVSRRDGGSTTPCGSSISPNGSRSTLTSAIRNRIPVSPIRGERCGQSSVGIPRCQRERKVEVAGGRGRERVAQGAVQDVAAARTYDHHFAC